MVPLLIFAGTFILSLWASHRVKSVYRRYAQEDSVCGLTGEQTARKVMEDAGIHDVEIHAQEGELTDHYDPSHKRLVLSTDNYYGKSISALAVSAHEAGHAIQHKVGYAMMTVRQSLAPATQIAAGVSNFVMIAGIFLLSTAIGGTLLTIGAVALAVICLFQLVTLPVEFDASRRAKAELVRLGIVGDDEMSGVHETLDAAALTYVAAFVAALASLVACGSKDSDTAAADTAAASARF
ncbi:MAG: zinc metallopeptidase [Planctomycetia bacterium]|nr:zinc metallopeptidase [Planctomycetia bacterium]